MTEREVEELANAIERLKRARTVGSAAEGGIGPGFGWLSLSLWAAAALTVFCLPAQILLAAYGGFRWIPPEYKALLWTGLALIVVGGGVLEVLRLILNGGHERPESPLAPLRGVIKVIFGGTCRHLAIPGLVAALTLAGFYCVIGHPWYAVSFTAVVLAFWLDYLGVILSRRDLIGMGWWCLVTGLASLFFVESAPLIWVFIIYGGLLYIFAGVRMANRRRAGSGR
jgi:hypothetical protein